MTSMAAMRAGEAHTWWEVPVNKVAELKKHGFDVIIYAERNRGLAGDSANQESIYTDKRIRAAVEYAIDRNAMAKALGYGYWEPMNQYASKKSNGYNPDYKGRPYNPEKAKRLLAEAGYPNGLKIRIVTVTTRQERDIWALIQRYLSKAGIDAEVSFMERGAFFAAANKGLKNALIDFKANMPLDLSKELSTMFMKGSPRLPLMSRPLELQEVLGRAERTPDYATQVSLTKKAVRMISEDALATSLWIEYVINIKNKSVRDVNYSHAWRYQWTPEDTWLSE
jgi:peptide/nickel transport system substrate-binding protein